MATNVTATVSAGGKTLNLVIEDITAVGAAISAAAGNMGAAQLIALIGGLAGKAVQGFEDGASIPINAETITALLQNVPLDLPTEVNPGPGH